MDKTAKIDPLRICPHDTVKREFDSEENYLDKWTCQMCHAEFFTLDGMKSGKIVVMEPQLTLRDQFAMAALGGMLHKDVTLKAEAVVLCEWAFFIADAMMKARTQ